MLNVVASKKVQLSFRAVEYFRKYDPQALKGAFKCFVIMLQDLELIEGQTIALIHSKFTPKMHKVD